MRVIYPAVIEFGDHGGFGAFFPDLPGCAAAGDTIEECKIDAGQALALHLAGMVEDGETFPEPTPLAEVTVDSDIQVEEIVLISASLDTA